MESSRREWLAMSAFGLVAGPMAKTKVRLGGPAFLHTDDMAELARAHRRLGYSAAYCPDGLKAGDAKGIAAVQKAFAAEDVIIAEVGAWKNMLDADPAKRRSNLAFVQERLALADEVGARCCVDIGGSLNPQSWDGPDPRNLTAEYFDATVQNCRRLIDAVKPSRTHFSIEMMGWSLPNTADSYLRLIKAVDRKAFGLHVDVCNIIDSPELFYSNGQVIDDLFQKLGPWVLSCHAKDVGGHATHLAEVIPGRGAIDYRRYLLNLASLRQETPLMLEHLETAAEYDEGRNYILRVGREAGVTFA